MWVYDMDATFVEFVRFARRIVCVDDVGAALPPADAAALEATLDAAFRKVTRVRIASDVAVLRRCDIVGVMAMGRLVELGPPAELLQDARSFLHTLPDAAAAPLP